MKVSLWCATLAIIGPLAFMIPYGTNLRRYAAKDVLITLASIIVILVPFYASAAFLGKAAGENICRERRDLGGAILLGIGVALGSLVVAALAVELAVLLAKIFYSQREAHGFLLLMILMFGTLPAILLGVLNGILMRWRLAKAGCC